MEFILINKGQLYIYFLVHTLRKLNILTIAFIRCFHTEVMWRIEINNNIYNYFYICLAFYNKCWRTTILIKNEVKQVRDQNIFSFFLKKIPHSYSESFIHLKHQLLYTVYKAVYNTIHNAGQRRNVFATKTIVFCFFFTKYLMLGKHLYITSRK